MNQDYKLEYKQSEDGKWRVVLDNGNTPYYPCSENLDNLKIVAEAYREELYRQDADEDSNYGLLFYVCGYSGPEQNREREWCDSLEVEVF